MALNSKVWLEQHSEPFDDVFKHWVQTNNLRRNQLANNTLFTTVSSILNEWPILKHHCIGNKPLLFIYLFIITTIIITILFFFYMNLIIKRLNFFRLKKILRLNPKKINNLFTKFSEVFDAALELKRTTCINTDNEFLVDLLQAELSAAGILNLKSNSYV